LIVGAVLIVGEVWIERDRGRHPTFVMTWRLSWQIAAAASLARWSGCAASDDQIARVFTRPTA
jgi:hypothetical protein